MERNILIVVALVVIALGGYFLFQNRAVMTNNGAVTPTVAETETQAPTEDAGAANSMTINLTAQNDSGQDGTATLTETDGKVMVSIDIPANADGVAQPAHIHVGACPKPGAVKYPLENVVDGASETTLEVTLAELKEMLPLAVNVHKSAEEASIYTACGDLK